jgi:hypothetical protein
MIDHMGGFADEATALAYPEWAQYHIPATENSPGGWDPSRCITDILIWDPAFDTTDPDTGDITHQPYDMIWRVIVTLPEASDALLASSPTQLVIDHETGETLLMRYFTEASLQRLWMQPIFVGSKYPFQTGEGGIVP